MDSLALMVYLFHVIAGLRSVLEFLTVTALLCTAFLPIIFAIVASEHKPSKYSWEYETPEEAEKRENIRSTYSAAVNKAAKWGLICFFVFGGLRVLTPDKQTMYVMAGAAGVESVAHSEAVGTLAPKSLAVVEAWLDKAHADLTATVEEVVE